MYIDENTLILLENLKHKSVNKQILNSSFIEIWLSEFERLDKQYQFFNLKHELLDSINQTKQDYEYIQTYYKANDESLEALITYPGIKDEITLLKWLCENSYLLDGMLLEIVELLEKYTVDKANDTVTFIRDNGYHEEDMLVDDQIVQFGKFNHVSTEYIVSELTPLQHTINFVELAYDLYFSKLEQYQFQTEEELNKLPQDHPDSVNRTNLLYQLKKHGIHF